MPLTLKPELRDMSLKNEARTIYIYIYICRQIVVLCYLITTRFYGRTLLICNRNIIIQNSQECVQNIYIYILTCPHKEEKFELVTSTS